jgi:ATP-dependent Clp protease protease subunit
MPANLELDNKELSPQDAGIYNFMGEVDTDNIEPIIDWILVENHVRTPKKKELILMINSDGGSVSDAFALIDVMNSSTVPIRTVGLGSIASAGLLIFLAGHTRTLTPNTSILSHQFSWGSSGKEHELFAVVKEFELTKERMINHYKSCTNLSEAQIKEFLLPPHDVYLSAQEALKLGLCDHIAEPAKARTVKQSTTKTSKR